MRAVRTKLRKTQRDKKDLENIITQAQKHLGDNLTKIIADYRMPKTLRELINNYYNNDIQKIIQTIPELSHLGLDTPTSEVISTIQKLINKPPLTVFNEIIRQEPSQTQETITKPEKETVIQSSPTNSTNLDTPLGEKLEVIIQLELDSLNKLFGAAVDSLTQQKIQEATSYSQVVQARQTFLAKHLNSSSNSIANNSAPAKPLTFWETERVFWLLWLLISLTTIGGLLLHIRKKNKTKRLK